MKKKSLFAGVMSACLLGAAAVAATTASAASTDYVYGDANLDGTVDMSDVVLIMQSLANPDKYGLGGTDENAITSQGIANADVDKNIAGVTTNDALVIQQYLLGKIKSF